MCICVCIMNLRIVIVCHGCVCRTKDCVFTQACGVYIYVCNVCVYTKGGKRVDVLMIAVGYMYMSGSTQGDSLCGVHN